MPLPLEYVKLTLVMASPQKNQFFNVFYYKPDGPPTHSANPMADSESMGGAITAIITASMPAGLTVDTRIVGWNCELHKAGQSYDTSGLLPTVGTVMSDELADFEAVVIQKRTLTAGKSGRGRWYLGPIPETLTDENYIQAANIPIYRAIAIDWCAPVTGLGVAWQAQLYSKKTDQLIPLTSWFVDPKLGQIGGRKSHSIL